MNTLVETPAPLKQLRIVDYLLGACQDELFALVHHEDRLGELPPIDEAREHVVALGKIETTLEHLAEMAAKLRARSVADVIDGDGPVKPPDYFDPIILHVQELVEECERLEAAAAEARS